MTLVLALVPVAVYAAGGEATLIVDATRSGPRLSPVQHGIFFEEINHAGDGGLYAEKVRNRRFDDGLNGWSALETGGARAQLSLDTGDRRAARVVTTAASGGRAGLRNEGYWGVGAAAGQGYDCLFEARADGPAVSTVRVAILGADGKELAAREVRGVGAEWRRFRCTLRPRRAEPKASLALTVGGAGTVWFSRVSLFPQRTYRGRSNGLRADLAAHVADVRPSFVRFPGGCFVEGDRLANRFNWKNTLGDPLERTPHANLWGYPSTNGLGYHEYLQWCEDMGAEPLFVVNCGMSHTDVVPMDRMSAYVQDALDAIEYANGDASTPWGARRAANGHPKPFGLKYMEIGNENGGPAYEERYALFWDAIKQRYPEMTLIANVPVRSRPMDVVDEHYYSSPRFFVQQSHRYDTYPRTGHKIYVGEYAVTEGCGQGNLIAALGEAFFITGMERNADVVRMASYAPLFVNTDNRAWNPDAIVFDTTRSYGTPSYWAQQMFSTNRGDVVVPTEVHAVAPVVRESGGVGVGTWATAAEFRDLRVEVGGKTVWTGDSTAFPLAAKTGTWQISGGQAVQAALDTDLRAMGGDPSWTDYTFSLKARKTAGAEGFLIMFRAKDAGNWYWWNVGGWGNTRHNIEHAVDGGKGLVAQDVPGRIETGRWYDIRIQVEGDRIRCWLDGALVHDARSVPDNAVLGAVATREEVTGDLLVKVVNITGEPQRTAVEVLGAPDLASDGSVTVLTSAKPTDENTFAAPRRVVPVTRRVGGIGPRFTYTFPPYSISILRLRSEEQGRVRGFGE